jgi:hypothetical protein
MKKTTTLFFNNRSVLCFLVPIFFIRFSYCNTSNYDISQISTTKHYLTQQLDSLDLQKQIRKRNGLSVTEIEQRQIEIKDSLALLKEHIQKAATAPTPIVSKRQSKHTLFSKPDNLFDWIIVIVGIIAIFSGSMLISGIVRSLHSKSKYRKKTAPHQQILSTNREPPTSAFPLYNRDGRTAPGPGPDPAVSFPDTLALDQLRQRIGTPPADSSPQTDGVPHLTAPIASASLPDDKLQQSTNIEQQIIAAARDGLDITALSRKFHLSSDHIALILKVAHKKQT